MIEPTSSDEFEAFDHLSRNDAQAFVVVIDEVSVRVLSPLKGMSIKYR